MGAIGDKCNMSMSFPSFISLESFLDSHPIFRYEEFASWKQAQGTTSPRAVKKILHYYLTTGRLVNPRREIYAVVSPNESPDQVSIDPYLLAAKITSDSVLAYHTALELHGVAYSVFQQFNFLTAQKSKPFEFQDQWFRKVAIPTQLKTNDKCNFRIDTINRQGVSIKVTNLSRTFVDVLDRIELSGGWEEVVRSISNISVLNIDEVITYCLMLNNHRLAAKVGFFLEQRKGAFAIDDKILKPLLQLKPLVPQYLSDHYGSCKLVKKWNVMLPSSVLKQLWEEPNHDV